MASVESPTTRPFWPRRLYQRFLDWLWFGPLTRDLRPPRPPSQWKQALALLADLCRMAVSSIPSPWRRRQTHPPPPAGTPALQALLAPDPATPAGGDADATGTTAYPIRGAFL